MATPEHDRPPSGPAETGCGLCKPRPEGERPPGPFLVVEVEDGPHAVGRTVVVVRGLDPEAPGVTVRYTVTVAEIHAEVLLDGLSYAGNVIHSHLGLLYQARVVCAGCGRALHTLTPGGEHSAATCLGCGRFFCTHACFRPGLRAHGCAAHTPG